MTLTSQHFSNTLPPLKLPILFKDFLGKVKDKAGDMERLLKDKDKHGSHSSP